MDSSLVEKLGLHEAGEARGSDGSGNNARSMKLIQVDSLTIGNLEFHHLTLPSRDYNTSPSPAAYWTASWDSISSPIIC